ncbi:MAG: hypothetical protein VYE55_06385, partial [Verrucomicrobiota bacterium]|nr:hypothetical protein [Verrucomicrobiota bacterium]
RFADLSKGDAAQFEGWPVNINTHDNDAREPYTYLPEIELPSSNMVVELTNLDTSELIYCYRHHNKYFKAPVYNQGTYTLRAGFDKAETIMLEAVEVN